MAYLLDANVFIQAKNLHYGFDFCPGFWDWLDQAHAAGRVFSVEMSRRPATPTNAPINAEPGAQRWIQAEKNPRKRSALTDGTTETGSGPEEHRRTRTSRKRPPPRVL